MTHDLTRAQLVAFLTLTCAILVATIAPLIVTGIWGKAVPDSLISMADKTVTGLVGVLGALGARMWTDRKMGEPAGTPGDPVNVQEARP